MRKDITDSFKYKLVSYIEDNQPVTMEQLRKQFPEHKDSIGNTIGNVNKSSSELYKGIFIRAGKNRKEGYKMTGKLKRKGDNIVAIKKEHAKKLTYLSQEVSLIEKKNLIYESTIEKMAKERRAFSESLDTLLENLEKQLKELK